MGLTTVDVHIMVAFLALGYGFGGRSARRLCGSFMFGGKSDKKISGTLNVSSLEVSWKDAEIAEDLIIGPGMLN
ncbi:unnamed protein product [Eretmochelys imbricata]